VGLLGQSQQDSGQTVGEAGEADVRGNITAIRSCHFWHGNTLVVMQSNAGTDHNSTACSNQAAVEEVRKRMASGACIGAVSLQISHPNISGLSHPKGFCNPALPCTVIHCKRLVERSNPGSIKKEQTHSSAFVFCCKMWSFCVYFCMVKRTYTRNPQFFIHNMIH